MADHDEAVKAQRHDLRHQLAVTGAVCWKDAEKLESYIDALIEKIPQTSPVL